MYIMHAQIHDPPLQVNTAYALHANLHIYSRSARGEWIAGTPIGDPDEIVDSLYSYGVATISRLLEFIGLFCKRAL